MMLKLRRPTRYFLEPLNDALKVIHMKMIKQINQEESGYILVMTLIFLVIGSLTLTPLLGFTFTQMETTLVYKTKMYELYTCDSAVEDGIHKLIKMPSPLDTLDFNDSYTYTTELINDRTADVTGDGKGRP